jgi:hypothetical protein
MDRIAFDMDEKLVNYLMIKSISLKDKGLFQGKTGIALTILQYGIYKGKNIYVEYSLSLIDEIFRDFSNVELLGMKCGKIGIGWGIEYASTLHPCFNKYIPCLDIIDKEINLFDCEQTDSSLATDLKGILHYILARMHGIEMRCETIPFSSDFLCSLHKKILNLYPNCIYNDYLIENQQKYKPDIYFFINKISARKTEVENLSIVDGMSNILLNWIYSNNEEKNLHN